jgi:hypothetical protein
MVKAKCYAIRVLDNNGGGSYDTIAAGLRKAIDLDVDFFQLSISTPYPGTQLFKDALEQNRLSHQDYKYYGQSTPIVKLDELSPEDILRFEKYAIKKFYFRPRQISNDKSTSQ